jgi:hypothetical protein
MDGGTVSSPGTLHPATACLHVDATHLDRQMRAASRPPVRLMRDTIIPASALVWRHPCAASDSGGWMGLLNFTIFGAGRSRRRRSATRGDYWHANTPDLPKLGIRAAALAASAILASSGGDTISAFPAGMMASGGPRITHVYRQSASTYVLTITHDTGNDLIIPQQAANGAGFALMDGGSVASPGPIISAVACARIDATHVLVTLASSAANPG